MQYEGGRQSVAFTTLETLSANQAAINGTDARIEVDGVFYAPTSFRLSPASAKSNTSTSSTRATDCVTRQQKLAAACGPG